MDAKKLKWIAMITMLLDHLGAGVIKIMAKNDPAYSELYDVLRFVGRIAFPIFLFLMVEGVIHTRSILRYIRDLLIFAFVSDFFFDLALFGKNFDIKHQNVYFTLFLCTFLTFGVINVCAVFPASDAFRYDLVLFLTAAASWVAYLIKCDYKYGGVLAFFVMLAVKMAFKDPLYAKQINVLAVFLGCIVLYLYNKNELGAFVALLPVFLYNGKRGNIKYKYFYYAYYPLHLALIAVIRVSMG